MIIETLRLTRDIGRIQDLSSILIRYGFGDIVQRLGIANFMETAGHVFKWKELENLATITPPVRFRSALEEMGPTFVKLGQILATRADLFSQEWIHELKKLQDQVPTLPYSDLSNQVEEDLGATPQEIFAEFTEKPIAAASMSQVYKARLQDGRFVIVKIRRPGIRAIIEADLRLLYHLSAIAEQEIASLQAYRPTEIVHQFALSIRLELDLSAECRNAERMARNFKNDPNIIIPKIYWQWTSERINVQEFIAGIPAYDIESINKLGLDRKVLAQRGATAVMKMVLEDGFFHADPHPGNGFCLEENKIAFIDFGMVGRLSEKRRRQLLNLLKGFVDKDTKTVLKVLLQWTNIASSKSRNNLEMDLDDLIDQYHGIQLNQIDITQLIDKLTDLLREYQLNLPPNLTLLLKALITLEGFGVQLDPNFNLLEVANPFLLRIFRARYSLSSLLKKGKNNLFNVAELLTEIPQSLSKLLGIFEKNSLGIQVHVKKPDWLSEELDRSVNRISVSLVTSALIVGSSIVTTAQGGSSSIIGMIGFIGAAFGGIWLLISILRSK